MLPYCKHLLPGQRKAIANTLAQSFDNINSAPLKSLGRSRSSLKGKANRVWETDLAFGNGLRPLFSARAATGWNPLLPEVKSALPNRKTR